MGYTPVDNMTITRDYETREIVITYILDTEPQVKRFKFEDKIKAMEFATKEFNQVAM